MHGVTSELLLFTGELSLQGLKKERKNINRRMGNCDIAPGFCTLDIRKEEANAVLHGTVVLGVWQ